MVAAIRRFLGVTSSVGVVVGDQREVEHLVAVVARGGAAVDDTLRSDLELLRGSPRGS